MAKRAAQDDATRPRKKTKAAAKRETRDKLKLAEHKKSISRNMTKLKKVCGRYKMCDADDQADALGEVTSEVVDWMTDIHDVVQEGEEFTVAISCLSYCTKVLQTASRLDYTYDYCDYDDHDFTLKSASGDVLYNTSDCGRVERALYWLWRELLIADASNASSDVLTELGKLGIKDNVFNLFPVGNNATDPDGYLYFASHWTPEMRIVADTLVSAGINEKLAEFAAKPSLKLYNDLVTDQLKPALIDALRKDIGRGASRSVPLDDALNIYSMNGLVADVLSLVPHTTQANVPDYDSTMRLIVKTLSRAALSHDQRNICYNLIYEGLLLAQKRIFDHLADLHPGLQNAKIWLQAKVLTKYKKRILLAERKPPFDQTAVILNEEVLEFIKIMTQVDDEYEKARLEEARLDRRYTRDDSDSEDDPCEADCQGRSDSSYPTLNLRLWLSLFCEWPRPEELTGIWDKVKWKDGADPFGMYGITPALIKDADGLGFRHLRDGLKLLYRAFGSKDIQTLTKRGWALVAPLFNILSHTPSELKFKQMALTNVIIQKEIDDRILELEAEIRVHRWRRNRHSAVSQLPVEVISQIFLEGKLIAYENDLPQSHDLHSLHQPPQPPRRSNIDSNRNWLNVSNVCRDWHNIVIDTPRLWSSITLGPADPALEMLKRSKSVPLQIRYTSAHDTPTFVRLSQAFMSQIHRIREIEIPSIDCYSTEFLLTNETAEASMLEVLKINGTTPYALPDPVLDRGMPSLRILTLANGTLTNPLPPLPRLTHLTINPSPVVSVEILLTSLRNTPNIESMSIACLSHTPSPHANLPTVSLPRLNHFCVSSSSIHASKIFDAMRYPRSTAIHYSTQRGHTRDEDLSSLHAVCSRYSMNGTAPILQLTIKLDETFLQMAAYTTTTTTQPASLSIMLPKSANVLVAYARLCSALPLSTIPRLLLHGLPAFNSLSSSFRQVRTLELSACHPAVIRSLLKDSQGQLPMPGLRKLMLSSFRLSNTRIQPNEDLCSPLKSVLTQRRKAKNSKVQSLVLTRCTVSSAVVNELRQLVPVDWDGFGPTYLEMEEMEEEDENYEL